MGRPNSPLCSRSRCLPVPSLIQYQKGERNMNIKTSTTPLGRHAVTFRPKTCLKHCVWARGTTAQKTGHACMLPKSRWPCVKIDRNSDFSKNWSYRVSRSKTSILARFSGLRLRCMESSAAVEYASLNPPGALASKTADSPTKIQP